MSDKKKIDDWTKPDKKGNIEVPVNLERLFNRIGIQIQFVVLSGKNPIQATAHLTQIADEYAIRQTTPLFKEIEKLKSEIEELNQELYNYRSVNPM
jgi:hypothetical protein